MENGIFQIAEQTWQIRYYWYDMADVYMYLLEGDEKALLIDTGYSNTRAIDYVRQVTDKPVILVNTHGHFDHVGGNGDFQEAYMSERDYAVYDVMREGHFTRTTMEHVVEMAGIPDSQALQNAIEGAVTILHAPLKPLPENGCFELGNRTVYFANTPGHTPGSIVLADPKTGILFTGDMACYQGVLLAFDHSSPVSEYYASVLKMQDFMRLHKLHLICPSHHEIALSDHLLSEFQILCEKIMSGEIKGTFRDMGTCQGLYAEFENAALVYNNI
jgi:hydroxyacylglutathione hydrolase